MPEGACTTGSSMQYSRHLPPAEQQTYVEQDGLRWAGCARLTLLATSRDARQATSANVSRRHCSSSAPAAHALRTPPAAACCAVSCTAAMLQGSSWMVAPRTAQTSLQSTSMQWTVGSGPQHPLLLSWVAAPGSGQAATLTGRERRWAAVGGQLRTSCCRLLTHGPLL